MKLYDALGREKILPDTSTSTVLDPIGRNLGQALPAARTLTTLYTVPSSTRTTGVKIMCSNRGPKTARFRVSHAIAGAADSNEQYLYVDECVPAYKTFEATIGLEMSATDELRAYSDNGQIAFNVYGQEITP